MDDIESTWKGFTISTPTDAPRNSTTTMGAKRRTKKTLSSTNIKKMASESALSSAMEKELSKILHNGKQCEQFRDFLKSRHSEENIYFWVEVELLKNEKLTPATMLATNAESIYKKYVIDFSPLQINVEGHVVDKISAKMTAVTRDMFNEAQDCVFKLMATSCMMNFTISKESTNLTPKEATKPRSSITKFSHSLSLSRQLSANSQTFKTYLDHYNTK